MYAEQVSLRDNNSFHFNISYIIYTVFTLLCPSLTVIIGMSLKSNFPYNTLLGRICLGVGFNEGRSEEAYMFEPRIRICICYVLIAAWQLFMR